MCFDMNCRYEKQSGECSLTHDSSIPSDAVCVLDNLTWEQLEQMENGMMERNCECDDLSYDY